MVDPEFEKHYKEYLFAAQKAWKSGSKSDLDAAYQAYVKCADEFWGKKLNIDAVSLPDKNWENFFAFTQTHSCHGQCMAPAFNCFGSLGCIGTYGSLGGCIGTAGTLGTFGTRGG